LGETIACNQQTVCDFYGLEPSINLDSFFFKIGIFVKKKKKANKKGILSKKKLVYFCKNLQFFVKIGNFLKNW
jgi:hypothetical protein